MGQNPFLRILTFFLILLTLTTCFFSIGTFIGSRYYGFFQLFSFYGFLQPLLIVLNIILLFYWMIRLKKWVIIPFLTLILNLEFINAVFQIPFPTRCLEPHQNRLCLCTYNVKGFYHGQRPLTVSMISDFMKEKGVDILCFQEMDFDSTYTVDSIAKAFPYLPYYAVAFSEKPGFNLMLLSKYPIREATRIHFGKEGNQAMSTDLSINGKLIRLFNFHLQTTYFNQERFPIVAENWIWDMSGEAEKSMKVHNILEFNFKKRTYQAAYLHKKIETSKYPTLVCGDMNSTPSSYTYHQIKSHLKDGFRTCGSGYEYTLYGLRKLFRIDYIFHSKDFEGYSYKSYLLDYSDHKPVIMEFCMK